tara:strand:- start:149 stop:433 length:285 start_codon:yes stop_codon:yes gene_type:complete
MKNKLKLKGRKYDGKSRVSNDLYRKNWDEIFKKKVMEGEDPFQKEQNELKESYEQSLRNKNERDPFKKEEVVDDKVKVKDLKKLLKEIDERNGF